jgi:predicted ester cyclase
MATQDNKLLSKREPPARLDDYITTLSSEEKGRLFDQLVSNLMVAPNAEKRPLAKDERRQQDVAVFYRYIEEQQARHNGHDDQLAALPLEEKERLFNQFLANPMTALALRQSEEQRLALVALTARYVEEQKARNYVLPEDETAMSKEEKEQLFDQITAGRVAVTDEEKRVENVAIFYRYIECENARDYPYMKKLFHPTEFRSKTYFGNDPISPEAHVRMLKGLFRAFPDWFMVIYEIISSDERACVGLITGRGTQHEEFFGRPPADHQIAIPTLHAIKCEQGVIVEHRHINPFEDIFKAQAMAPLTEDVMAVRAQQGFDSSMAQKAFDDAIAAGASEEKLAYLHGLMKNKVRQCQTLLKGTLRRCAMIAEPGELYCAHHISHGYGVDGIED